MIIEIVRPTFKCAEDENIFFSRLNDISGCENIAGKGLELRVTFAGKTEQAVISEIQEICNIWHTTYRVLNE